jgi:PAS domain S-box-containing protein
MRGKNWAALGGRLPERMLLLAVVQALLVLGCGLSAAGVVGAAQVPAQQGILAGLFAVTVVLSLTWSASGSLPMLQLDLAMTSVLIAAATLLQPTSRGQLVLGLFVLVVAIWSASFLPWGQAVAQFALGATLYVVALLAGPTTGTPVYGLAILVSAAFAGLVVMRGRAAGSRYSGLVSKAVDVVLLSTDGRWTWASAGIEEELGWKPAEFLELEEPVWHPDDDETVSDIRRRVAAGEPVTATYRLRHKDGRYRWVEARVSPTGDTESQARTVWLLREVTEHMQAERALARSSSRNRRVLQRLRRKDEAKTQQFHDLSHELRAPLTVIRAPLERHLQRADDLPEELRTDLAAAVRAGRRLEGLVDGVLDIAQSVEAVTGPGRRGRGDVGVRAAAQARRRGGWPDAVLGDRRDVSGRPADRLRGVVDNRAQPALERGEVHQRRRSTGPPDDGGRSHRAPGE